MSTPTPRKAKAPRAKAINSRDKGKRGELELAEFLREHGYPDAARGVQYKGGPNSADITGGPAEFHLECKRRETGNLYVWLEQAKRDAAGLKVPLVCHRKDRQEWVAILTLEDLLLLMNGKAL